MTPYLVALVVVLIVAVLVKQNNTFKYWKKRRVNGPKPAFFTGNFFSLITKKDSISSVLDHYYKAYPNEKVVGLYQALDPLLLVRDPELIKKVLIKDFASFAHRGLGLPESDFSKNLFVLDGEEWKVLRQKLTPVFTTGKLKQMMPLLNNCATAFDKHLNTIVDQPGPKEVRGLFMKYTLKGITAVAFGLDIDTFSDEDSEFIKMARLIFEPNFKRELNFILSSLLPSTVATIIAKIFDLRSSGPGLEEFFISLVNGIIKEREGKPKQRMDFMDFMIDLKEQGTARKAGEEGMMEMKITLDVIISQAMVFYAAGYETSAGTVSFLMYELAMNPEAQEKCYQEIKGVMEKYNGVLSYEALSELQYVNMAFEETMRKHPVVGNLIRQCNSDIDIPEEKLKIEKGTKIAISMTGVHMDPKNFPDPDRFDPERFAPENRGKIQDCTFIPFGDGPRNCIGLRFGRIQSLLGVAQFLHKVRVEPSERTPKKIQYDPTQITLAHVDGLWLNLVRR